MKNDGTYFITFQHDVFKTKKHYPQSIHPFKWQSIEFFVHRVASGLQSTSSIQGEEPIYSDYFYQVTNKDTGLSLSIRSATRIVDARKQAIDKLEKVGIDRVKEVIEKAKGYVK